MKRLALFTVSVIVAGLVVAYADRGGEEIKASSVKALSINDIQSDPLSFTGEIKINGVAAAFSEADETFFGIMDTAELMACKDLYCGAYALPAKYTGSSPMPKLADVVDVTGSFVKTDTEFYFAVTDFEVRRNIMRLISR
ncbi:MAG: hypothetical protein FWG71_02790 [Synergistaceae bacterium]|nr:hypothetical protein [Synergistaceae bacterium]